MSLSAEMFIVVSLLLAVFAAISAVGTSIVLGVGYERLRAGFDTVKKQTAFFADAIHKLDNRSTELGREQEEMKKTVGDMSVRVDSVEKQTGFFFSSLQSLESQILDGHASHHQPMPIEREDNIRVPDDVEWMSTADTKQLLRSGQRIEEQPQIQIEPTKPLTQRISSSVFSYLTSDNTKDHMDNVVYH